MEYKVNGITWKMLHIEADIEWLGAIPYYFHSELVGLFEPEMLVRRGYAQTAGCTPNEMWNPGGSHYGKIKIDEMGSYKYPGDPVQKPIASAFFGADHMYFYESAMFAIVKPTGEQLIWRLD